MIPRRILHAFYISLLLPLIPQVTSAQIEHSMQLLAPNIGWVLQGDRLYWTTDNGRHWKEITPRDAASQEIAWVTFLDASTGWVLLTLRDDSNDPSGFDLASTTNAGASWTITPVKIPKYDPRATVLNGNARMTWADSHHGWIDIEAGHFDGLLLATADAGKTWKDIGGVASMTAVCFLAPNDGWATTVDNKFYRTHDGGHTWTEVSPRLPSGVHAISATYDLPLFLDIRRGFLVIGYREDDDRTLALFASENGGRNWKLDRQLTNLHQTASGTSTVADSTWIVATGALGYELNLTKVEPGGKTSSITGRFTGDPFIGSQFATAAVTRLSFLNVTSGWATIACCGTQTNLLSTGDGGVTWTNITPTCTRILNLRKGEMCATERN